MACSSAVRWVRRALALAWLVSAFAVVASDLDAAPAVPATTSETWTEIPGVNPRVGAAAVEAGGKLVLIGGSSNYPCCDDVWSLDLSSPTSDWVAVAAGGTQPPIFSEHTAVFDPVGNRVLVFGGYDVDGYPSNDLWELTLGPAPAWSLLSPGGTLPGPRQGHTAIYDPVGRRMLIFGGADVDQVPYDDVWALSLDGSPQWTLVTPAGAPPSARFEHVAIYDPVGERMILSGGFDPGGFNLGDQWALSLEGAPEWTPLAPSGTAPSPRSQAVAVYDPSGHRMIVSGGYDLGGVRGDTWALDLGGSPSWTPLATGPVHFDVPGVYDPATDRLVVFGVEGSQVWSLGLGPSPVWSEVRPPNATPGWRSGHSAIYDPVRRRKLVIGGYGPSSSDVWSLSLGASLRWSRLAIPVRPSNPAAAVYDPQRDRVLALDSSTGPSQIWQLTLSDPMAWSQLSITGTPPGPYFAASAIYDPVRDRLLFDGVTSGGVAGEIWALSLAGTPAWSPVFPTGVAPVPRTGQAVIYDPPRDRMILYDGYGWTGGAELSDLWQLSFSGTPAWTQLFPSGTAPSRRQEASAIYDPVRDRMVVLGGVRFQTTFIDVRYLSLAGSPAWSLGPSIPDGFGLANHSAVYDPIHDRMVVFGGITGGLGEPRADAWMLTWGAPLDAGHPGTDLGVRFTPPRPNPARQRVTFEFALEHAAQVRLEIFDLEGRRVRMLRDDRAFAGSSTISWDLRTIGGSRVAPGLYTARMAVGERRLSRRLVILE